MDLTQKLQTNLTKYIRWSTFSFVNRGILTVQFQTEKLSHADLDERALDALKEFPVEGALAVLKQFLESNLVDLLSQVFIDFY